MVAPFRLIPPGTTPDKDALGLALTLFGRRATGVFSSPELEGSATLVEGDPADRASLEWLLEALVQGDLLFNHTPVAAEAGLRGALGVALLDAGGRLAQPDEVLAALDHGLVDGPFCVALARLPISDALRETLALRRDPRIDVAGLLRQPGADHDHLVFGIAALVAMRVLRLRAAAGRADTGPAGPFPRPTPVPRRQAPPPASEVRVALLMRRLRREWSEIAHADDWTVIGVSHGDSPEVIQRACGRVVDRFAVIAEDESLPEAVVELAERINERVSRAARAVQNAPPSASPEGDTASAATAFRKGQEALLAGRVSRSAAWFAWARRQDPESARSVAWHGWATFHDPAQPTRARRLQGLDLVRLSTRMEPSNPDFLFMLARLELEVGNVFLARAALERLLRVRPGHPGGQALWARLKEALQASSA